jgi:prolyl oligopeptidase
MFTYPHTPTVDQVDDYHGRQIADPYRWLEDTGSAETAAWIEAQNALTFDFLGRIPVRRAIQERLKELWDFPRQSAPLKRGGRYFQLRNSGLQNQDALYVMEQLDGEAQLLLDPNSLSEDGTVALNIWSVSHDGQWLAYATSASGSDWLTWRVRHVLSGQDLPDRLEWSKFSDAAWRRDQSGFYYARYDEPVAGEDYTGANYFHKLYFHRLGEPQANDQLVYERPDQKEWGFAAQVSDDDGYLVIHAWQGTDVRNRIFYQELDGNGPVVALIPELEASFAFVGNDGPRFYFRTDLNAPRGRLLAIDVSQPDKANWETIIPEGADTLEGVIMVHQEFVALYLHHAHHQLRRFDRHGRFLGDIALPAPGAIPATGNFLNLTGQREDDELFYGFCSFLYPPTIYRYDFARQGSALQGSALQGSALQGSALLYAPPIPFDSNDYVTRQLFVTSKNGTQLPLFLTHRQDLALDGRNPTLLFGYGGFNVALTPNFQVSRLAWFEQGGILAWACLRGGGEYGQEWHQAGKGYHKQNVFDDFIACAEYLVAEGITSPQKLAIMGGSNGGLLVGACLTQRPELFGAAVPVVGVLDMLRFHRFTIGWAWVSDYGSADDPEMFETLLAYSPLHNVRPGRHYPATLIVTADHDDRVVPGHSFKFAATLQAAQAGEAPILIRIQQKAGHGLGKPTRIQIEEAADIWAFLTAVLK